jgi:hypothetical protein
MFILPDFGEEDWILCLSVPGIVPWTHRNESFPCGLRLEDKLSKKYHTFEEVVQIGKNTCARYGWVWDNTFYNENEFIDYSFDPPKNLI